MRVIVMISLALFTLNGLAFQYPVDDDGPEIAASMMVRTPKEKATKPMEVEKLKAVVEVYESLDDEQVEEVIHTYYKAWFKKETLTLDGNMAFEKQHETIYNNLAMADLEYKLARRERDLRILQDNETTVFTFNVMSYAIGVLVHAILFFALFVSYKELKHAGDTRNQASKETEINISLESLALKTSANGVLLLVFSAIFYFMYLKFVFPIFVMN